MTEIVIAVLRYGIVLTTNQYTGTLLLNIHPPPLKKYLTTNFGRINRCYTRSADHTIIVQWPHVLLDSYK